MAFWLAALPFLQAAGIGAAGAVGAKMVSGSGKKGAAPAPAQGSAPPMVIKDSAKEDAVKAVLVENIKNEKEARQALHDAESALTRETVKDISETASSQ